jgi:peroxiredoxin Q/BCP
VRRAPLLALALLALAVTARAAEPPSPLAVGAVAPDSALVDMRGQPVRLADLLKQHDFVVVAFYVKAFTGGWTLEFSRFRESHAKYTALNAEIVGVSADPPDRNLAWAQELKLPFNLLTDKDGKVSRQWGAWDDTWNLPKRVTFVVDRTGRIRYVEPGSLAIETDRTLDALGKLARAK